MIQSVTRITFTSFFATLVAALSITNVSAASGSAEGAVEAHPMVFQQITLDQGLSQSNVLSILQDRGGMMWFGTENGLNRYDGYQFDHFKRERGNAFALSSDFIFDVAEDSVGNFWIATNGGGLVKMDKARGVFTAYRHDPNDSNSVSSNIIRRLLIDDRGIVWAATRRGGLDRFDPVSESFEHVPVVDGIDSTPSLYALFIDADGLLWVGGEHGLTRLDRSSGERTVWRYRAGDTTSLGRGSVRTIAADASGALWVGTYGGGLNRLQKGKTTFERFTHDASDEATLSGDRVTSLLLDTDKRLWVGTTAGLNLVDTNLGSVQRYTHDANDVSSLSDNNITTLYQDRSGLIWVGTKTRGLNTWNPRSWGYGFEAARELTADGQSKPNVTSFAEDGQGTLWLGTYGEGLSAINRVTGEIVKYRTDASSDRRISDDRVMALLHDRRGMIWAGTMTRGLIRIDPATGEREYFGADSKDPHSLNANGVMALFESHDGSIWVGTHGGGISRFDQQTERFTHLVPDADSASTVSSSRVTSFAQDNDGRLWIGTEAGGLNLYDPNTETFTHFRHDPSNPATLADDTVYAVNVASDGTVWVGTRGGGLDRVIGDAAKPETIRFSNLSQADGLTNDVIYGIQFDDSGWLWMSTNYGISKYHPDTRKFAELHRKDGLQSEEFNFGAHYRSDSGELFFGGANGYNAFDPAVLELNTVAPLVALTGFFRGNDSVRSDLPTDDDGNITIGWDQNDVSFEFAALDYTASADNIYQYKLEGHDASWINLGNARRITYTDLDDGRYLLRVRAANSDGTWSESDLTLPLSVAAAPWDSWWAYLGYLILAANIAGGLVLGHRRKIQREEAYSLRLEQEVRQRTECLADSNRQLETLNRALQESSLSDPLTGLRNRRFVFEEVSRDIEVIQRRFNEEQAGTFAARTSELVFMMIDLDHFKPINDTYGHSAGDRMLLELRDVLLDICRRTDFVIRWGGDEFVVIAKQAKPEESEALAERIRSTIDAHSFTLGDGQVARTTCSIGFVAYPLFQAPAEESSLDHIINIADGLMYEAKRQRNAWVGMLSPDEAVTSENFDHDAIESTSLLFQARRARNLNRYVPHATDVQPQPRLRSIG